MVNLDLRNTLVFILAGGEGSRLKPLTLHRAKPAVPFGGCYRIIDFTLSNCIHSGLRRIHLLTQYQARSLEEHIRFGWNFLPRRLEQWITCSPPHHVSVGKWYRGTADAIFHNLDSIEDWQPPNTVVLSGDHIYQMDYRDMLREHVEHNAALTIGAVKIRAGGRKVVFAEARDVREVSSGWVVAGMHEVPEGLVKPPRVNAALPAAGKGEAGSITFFFDDASDVSNLQTVWVVMGKGVEGKQACSVAYHVPDNAVYLLPDDGDGARARGVEMTLANAVENGQCRVSAAGSAAMKTGPRLTLTLQYTFKPGFEGTWGIWTALQTKGAKETTGWKVSGVWTVPGE